MIGMYIPTIVFGVLALVIALHHCWVHSSKENDKARQESCPECCYLQPSDMANHEIWVVSCLAASVTWFGAVFYFT